MQCQGRACPRRPPLPGAGRKCRAEPWSGFLLHPYSGTSLQYCLAGWALGPKDGVWPFSIPKLPFWMSGEMLDSEGVYVAGGGASSSTTSYSFPPVERLMGSLPEGNLVFPSPQYTQLSPPPILNAYPKKIFCTNVILSKASSFVPF